MNSKLMRIAKTVFLAQILFFSSLVSVRSFGFALKNNQKLVLRGKLYGKRSVTGKACVITSPSSYALVENGCIVVAAMTSSEYESVLKKCAAIITNTGDEWCHAVLFGIRNNIPVLIGTGNATDCIEHGSFITLEYEQGLEGYVKQGVSPYNQQKAGNQVMGSIALEHTTETSQPLHHRFDETSGKTGCLHEPAVPISTTQNYSLCVSPELFCQKLEAFVKEVQTTQSELAKGRYMPTFMFKKIVRLAEKCDSSNENFIFSCIKVSYKFFDKSFDWIKERLAILDIDKVNAILAECSHKPDDLNWLAMVSYRQHVNAVELPAGVNKQAILQNPDLYAQIVDAGKVNEEEYSACIVAGLFARACVKNKWI